VDVVFSVAFCFVTLAFKRIGCCWMGWLKEEQQQTNRLFELPASLA
jgi:hypothetical protein